MKQLRVGIATALLVLAPAWAAAPVAALSAAPTTAEVTRYTQPLVRARLRIPDSLQAFVVAAIKPSADDAMRFEVEVRFKAKTPFGAITPHQARFAMKRSRRTPDLWIVTSD